MTEETEGTEETPPRPDEAGDGPPIGGRWSVLYAGVLVNLALLVALLWLLSRAFR